MSQTQDVRHSIYPYTEWEIIEEQFTVAHNARNETVFALGNGYLGLRGNLEEGYSGPQNTGLEGTYLNGFYETEIMRYPEIAYGYAEKSQTMLNVSNGKIIKLLVEDEVFNLLTGQVLEYQRVLHLHTALLTRSLIWQSPQGRQVKVQIERLVSLTQKHLAAIRYAVTPLNFHGKLQLVSTIDGHVTNLTVENDPRIGAGLHGRALSVTEKTVAGSLGLMVQKTKNSGLAVACAMEHTIETECLYRLSNTSKEDTISVVYEVDAQEGASSVLHKYLAYADSRDYAEAALAETTRKFVGTAKQAGYTSLKDEQQHFMQEFWNTADVVIKGDPALQQGVRFNIFHLLQSVGRDGQTNIAAKGLTGEGYEGHYFWDTEMFVLPVFLFNHPEISRDLLLYRYNILDKARERARQMAHPKGALFPWRTINGEECSAYFPAGTAQYHIDADIAFAVNAYVHATDDTEFLINYGAEILCETARLWADLGDFIPRKGNQFCINCVTGPDEYTALVNNNCYTNLMAKENLYNAYTAMMWLKGHAPEQFARLADKIGLTEEELTFWKQAADVMYIPYDQETGLYLQDDNFLERTPWDFAHTPEENYPLLIHYHPLVIYRHQVCKQADLVLALFLLSDRFTQEEKRRNYDFYEHLTTHDSSLSSCVFSIVASDIGYHDKAYAYFMETARMDLDDTHKNTPNGIHVANMGGTWMCIVNGFAGMRVQGDTLHFKPYLPEHWDEYSFNVMFKGRRIRITVNAAGTHYALLAGSELVIYHDDQPKVLGKEY